MTTINLSPCPRAGVVPAGMVIQARAGFSNKERNNNMNRNKRVARVPGTFAAAVILANLVFALYMLALLAKAASQ